MGVENVKLEPVDFYLGNDQAQVEKITCVEDNADSLDGKYGFFYDKDGNKHYFWFNTSGGAAVDPAIAGYTAHVVAITTGDSANAVATALAAVLTAVAGFDATASGYVVTLTHTGIGYALNSHDAQADADKTGFGFKVTTVGDTYASIGLLDGDVSVSGLGRNPVDVTAHQHGTQILGQILSSGSNPEITASIKEVTSENMQKLLRYSSGAYLPVGGSQALVGGGSLGVFGSPLSTKAVLHPVRLDAADKSEDLCFWKASLDLDGVTFSGENIMNLPFKMKAFKDTTKPKAIDTWVLGDWSQSLT